MNSRSRDRCTRCPGSADSARRTSSWRGDSVRARSRRPLPTVSRTWSPRSVAPSSGCGEQSRDMGNADRYELFKIYVLTINYVACPIQAILLCREIRQIFVSRSHRETCWKMSSVRQSSRSQKNRTSLQKVRIPANLGCLTS